MEIRRRPYRAIAKAIRAIESCETFEQLTMAHNYSCLADGYRSRRIVDEDIYSAYENKYDELKPREDDNESNS